MKTITYGDDLLGVEDFANALYRRIPKLWRDIFPSWFTIVVNPSMTFLTFDSLRSTIREVNYDAREISEWAERSEDWKSVHVLLPLLDKFRTANWKRIKSELQFSGILDLFQSPVLQN